MANLPPGPRADPARHPRLFALIDEVARALNTAPPTDVFFVADVNAYVLEEKRLFRAPRRVLSIGVGALHVLRTPALAAVLAHELAHLDHGDTNLASTRHAARSVFSVAAQGFGESSLGKLAQRGLEATQGASREVEIRADAAAVRVMGRAPYAEALIRSTLAHSMFLLFLEREVTPLLERGRIPENLFDGLHAFLDEGAPTIGSDLLETIRDATTDLADSHPALLERLTHLQAALEPEVPLCITDQDSESLVDDIVALQIEATRAWADRLPLFGQFETVAWSEVAEEVLKPWLTMRAKTVAALVEKEHDLAAALEEILDAAASEGAPNVARRLQPGLEELDDSAAQQMLGVAVGHLLGGLMIERGARISYRPGHMARLLLDTADIEPLSLGALALRSEDGRAQIAELLQLKRDANRD